MTERHVVIATSDGPMQAFVTTPTGTGPFAAVLMVQHIGGLSDTMRIMARGVARLGYCCVVPALYHRLGSIVVDPVDATESVAAIRRIAVASLTPARLDTDIGATLAWLGAQSNVRQNGFAIMGFGGGAGQALRLAADFPTAFRAFISILGVGFILPDNAASPHRRLGELSGGSYFGFAGDDEIIPPTAVEALRQALAASGAAHEVVVHAGVRHGYAFPDRAAYSEAAAEDDWARIDQLLARHLAGPNAH